LSPFQSGYKRATISIRYQLSMTEFYKMPSSPQSMAVCDGYSSILTYRAPINIGFVGHDSGLPLLLVQRTRGCDSSHRYVVRMISPCISTHINAILDNSNHRHHHREAGYTGLYFSSADINCYTTAASGIYHLQLFSNRAGKLHPSSPHTSRPLV
jgi:hypothetical protein